MNETAQQTGAVGGIQRDRGASSIETTLVWNPVQHEIGTQRTKDDGDACASAWSGQRDRPSGNA